MADPLYKELPIDPSKPPRSAWGVWGDDDQLGTLNRVGAQESLRGLACAKKGLVFPLNLPLDQPDPPLFGRRSLQYRPFPNEVGFDDVYDALYSQASSQWDGLSHVAHPEHGFYNGRSAADFTGEPGTKNGIEHFARKGLVARAVLLDVERYFKETDRAFSGGEKVEFTVEDLEATRKWAGIEYEHGDVLLVRTGWWQWYQSTDATTREGLSTDWDTKLTTPGLIGDESMAEYIWDSGFAAVAGDNPALEAWPHAFEVDVYLHYRAIALLGLTIGEMFDLDALAEDCAEDGVYECLIASAPMNTLGGVGSIANALAVK